MSRIKIYALGGLGENGKNMYVCDIENRIFILDAGLKYPSDELFGVDSIIPDISHLVKQKWLTSLEQLLQRHYKKY